MRKSLKVLVFEYIVPLRLLSGITYFLMHARHFPFRDRFMAFMIKRHHIKVEEALEPDYTDRSIHPTINSFFVRALKPEARPIAEGEQQLCSPADGTVSQLGKITDGKLFQAKGHSFSLTELLGGSELHARAFEDGHFSTIYLSPSDYHRVHIPFAGTLKHMIHIPGRLQSVAPIFIEQVPGLFARNERVVSIFDTAAGPMAVILVGAVNVGSIETVWAGRITPPYGSKVTETNYENKDVIQLDKGAELGRFNMGSTVILLFAKNKVEWLSSLAHADKVQMGEVIAELV
ncbi:MAG: phosphatidylserine decarboxylase [Gammaproteobacteria bacterium]|nr:phosphatidylserine decarboxylase [Gammaproteobacteria bacterium]